MQDLTIASRDLDPEKITKIVGVKVKQNPIVMEANPKTKGLKHQQIDHVMAGQGQREPA